MPRSKSRKPTADRLAAYRDELLAKGFTGDEATVLVVRVAPDDMDDVVLVEPKDPE